MYLVISHVKYWPETSSKRPVTPVMISLNFQLSNRLDIDESAWQWDEPVKILTRYYLCCLAIFDDFDHFMIRTAWAVYQRKLVWFSSHEIRGAKLWQHEQIRKLSGSLWAILTDKNCSFISSLDEFEGDAQQFFRTSFLLSPPVILSSKNTPIYIVWSCWRIGFSPKGVKNEPSSYNAMAARNRPIPVTDGSSTMLNES